MLFRQRSSHSVYWLLLASAALTSCTAPIATATVTPSSTRLTAATSTPLPTATPSLTPSPVPGADWIGEWNVYVNGMGGESFGTGTFTIDGATIDGEFALNHLELGTLYYRFSGKLSEEGTVVIGEWELQRGGSGSFNWKLSPENPNQFSGNLEEGKFQFCGWREGANRPSPCEWPID